MLLFIPMKFPYASIKTHFNTSHVTVYLHHFCNLSSYFLLFQYISCYCLSHPTQTRALYNCYFNTSHVTVYPKPLLSNLACKFISIHLMLLFICKEKVQFLKRVGFQYISCYCLSKWIPISARLPEEFQYISCYCLSRIRMRFIQKLNDFNTSHVTVYRGAMKVTTLTARHFNTSHVTVYLENLCSALSLTSDFNTSHVTVYPRWMSYTELI